MFFNNFFQPSGPSPGVDTTSLGINILQRNQAALIIRQYDIEIS